MKVFCSYSELVPLEKLVPNPRNDNKHEKEHAELLAKVMRARGIRHPIIVSKRSGFIVAGHLRLMAALINNYESYPVDYQDFESEADEYAFLSSDNNVARYAEFDKEKFIDNLKDLDVDFENFDHEEYGFLDFELPEIEVLEPQCDEDEVPEVKEDPITKRGDVWLLGRHRLKCGDSTMIDDVEKLMNGEKADMVFTDPPYGMLLDCDYSKMHVGGKTYDNIIGDHDDFKDEFIQNIFTCFDYCGEIFLWGADYYRRLIPDGGSWVVWDKRSSENHSNLDKLLGSAFELCWSKQKHKRDIARVLWSGHHGMNKEDTKKRCHPSQKPSGLCEWFFNKWGKDKNIIVDLFLGSGSTLIACEKTNRKCFGMELDEHYCDVIINRYMKFTDKDDVILESTGEKYNDIKMTQKGKNG